MIDIEKEFRRMMFGSTTSNTESDQSTITADELLEDMKRIQKEIGLPPPSVRLSRHAPAMGDARPQKEPRTDDMRAMVNDIGPQQVSVAWHLDTDFGRMVIINPVHLEQNKPET